MIDFNRNIFSLDLFDEFNVHLKEWARLRRTWEGANTVLISIQHLDENLKYINAFNELLKSPLRKIVQIILGRGAIKCLN